MAALGVTVVSTAADAVRGASVVICMLSSGPVCDEVLFGSLDGEGAARAMAPGAILVVMNSIPVETAKHHAQQAGEYGFQYVDAPVSGGEKGAREGTLAIMAGGEAEIVQSLATIFVALGRVTHIGPVGTRSLAKLANQLIEHPTSAP